MTVSFGSKVVSHFYFKYIYTHSGLEGADMILEKIEPLLFSKYDFLFGYPDESGTNGGN